MTRIDKINGYTSRTTTVAVVAAKCSHRFDMLRTTKLYLLRINRDDYSAYEKR